jgi:hypothetical protein
MVDAQICIDQCARAAPISASVSLLPQRDIASLEAIVKLKIHGIAPALPLHGRHGARDT